MALDVITHMMQKVFSYISSYSKHPSNIVSNRRTITRENGSVQKIYKYIKCPSWALTFEVLLGSNIMQQKAKLKTAT